MSNNKPLRVSEAAKILQLSPGTVRNWCNEGKLEYELSISGQRVFNREYIHNLARKSQGLEPVTTKSTIFYTRSSDGNDVSLQTQLEKLEKHYGSPDKAYKDKASGLSDKRRRITSIIELL